MASRGIEGTAVRAGHPESPPAPRRRGHGTREGMYRGTPAQQKFCTTDSKICRTADTSLLITRIHTSHLTRHATHITPGHSRRAHDSRAQSDETRPAASIACMYIMYRRLQVSMAWAARACSMIDLPLVSTPTSAHAAATTCKVDPSRAARHWQSRASNAIPNAAQVQMIRWQ